jgi:hypothetical protein
MAVGYIPERGDAVWIDFNPQAGHEQAGRPDGRQLFCHRQPITEKSVW